MTNQVAVRIRMRSMNVFHYSCPFDSVNPENQDKHLNNVLEWRFGDQLL